MSGNRVQDEGSKADKPPVSSAGDRARLMTEGSEPSLPGGGTYFLGRYRIVDEIGVGGMASVHLARADGPGGFQKWVAIKRIHRHLAEDASFIQMFLDEARIAARISHPNVAQVFDLGTHKDTYWIAMEYLHGEPLREVMRAVEDARVQHMEPELAAKTVSDAAEGLHAAHELRDNDGKLLNLVHRDVSPHNLFLTYDGAVKVVDFGIAKVTGRMSTTRAGTLKGKLAYMSPEQVRGAAIDRRTDVFALGVVLWELTTGRRLFRMETDLETLERVQACVVPPPSSIIDGYPVELESIVMRALAKDVNRRFATARELSRGLQQYLMHCGSFVGSDEIGAYVKDALVDRYHKREAHLQWAAEVTQTIALDQLEKRGTELDEVSILTEPSGIEELPAPAAGELPAPRSAMPSSTPRNLAPPPPSRSASKPPPPSQRPSVPPSSSASLLQAVLADDEPVQETVAPELPSYDVDTAVGITEDSEPLEIAAEPLPPPTTARVGMGPAAPPFVVSPPPPMVAPLPPVAAPAPPAPPRPPPQPPLPAFELASTSGVSTAPARHAYSEDDNALTTVMRADAGPRTISTIHAPAKSVQPAPQPDARIVISQADSLPYFAPPLHDAARLPAPAELTSPESTAKRGALLRDSRLLLIGITAAATTLIALALTTLVVLELTSRSEDKAATVATAERALAAAAPAVSAAKTEAARPDQPVDPSSLPTEDTPKRGGVEQVPSAAKTPPTLPQSPRATSTRAPKTAVGGSGGQHTRSAAGGGGYLTIVCDPFCDSVQAGGRSLGPSPVVRASLPAGAHAVVLRRKGSAAKTISVTIVSGETTAQRVKMGT